MKNMLSFLRMSFLCALLLPLTTSSIEAKSHKEVTVANPLLYSDVPDPDVICVGRDYYMISTTMHLSPGAPVMHSRDMKHWRIIGYVFDTLHESPANDLDGGNVYGRGQWAASLRWHKGLFYVFFGTGGRSYVYTAKDPAGPWTMKAQLGRYYHDASLLFDSDGKVYLVHCAGGALHVKQFAPDFQGFTDGDGNGEEIIALHDGFLHEGVHAYKINGKYYMTTIWWPAGSHRTQLCFRADKLTGPYEHRVILSDDLGYRGHGVAQGGIWQAHSKQWYAMLFQDHEGVGRIPCLLPCRWVDGWPMLGDVNGKVPQQFVIPGVKEDGETVIAGSDDFSSPKLSLIWQWNHNPDDALWSLTERPGYLRLRTGKVVQQLFEARNTLTQRTLGPTCQGTVRLDISHMLPGDRAGLVAFCSQPGGLTVERTDDAYVLQMSDRDDVKAQTPLSCGEVWLRMDCDFTSDTARFSYSTDGRDFLPLGTPFHMIFSMKHFTGNKFALFNYATRQAGGYVDIDSFDLVQ